MEMLSTVPRRGARAVVVTLGLGAALIAAPAHGTPPTTWEEADNGSVLHNLLIVVGIPLLVIAVITLLVYLPSMMRGQTTEPALAFREKPEWFGGPSKGVDATQEAPEEGSTKGGASARW